MTWDPEHLPSQAGRTIVVTGGGAGIGYFISEQLAAAGARVIIASRSRQKAALAIASIREVVPDADLVARRARSACRSARSQEAADRIRRLGPIDALINNAGLVVSPSRRQVTDDGHELVRRRQLPRALRPHRAGVPLDRRGRAGGRAWGATRPGWCASTPRTCYSDRRYRPFRAYGLSKHAVQGFALELDRRLRAAGDSRASLLAHPGYSSNAYASKRAGITDRDPAWQRLGEKVSGFVGQGKDHGAWPAVRAALDPDAVSGQYYGPSRRLAGRPVLTHPAASSASPAFGARLWADAERRTGIPFPSRPATRPVALRRRG